MTEDDYDALSQKHLASIKRDMRVSLEDAAVRATHKVMAELDCVGWFGYDTGLRLWFETNKGDDGAIPLYKDQPQRTWVGLTKEEINQGLLRSFYVLEKARAWRDGVAWAMQQLKDKNNV